MRLVITGGGGFLGRHTIDAALAAGHEVFATSRTAPVAHAAELGGVAHGLDLADTDRLRAFLRDGAPDAVVHLAGFANVGWSHREPAAAITANTAGTASLLSAVADACADAHVVLASTSEVYARSAQPLREDAPLAPESPYGWSKAFMESLAGHVARTGGLSIGVIRSFAHCGPGQGAAFALSNWSRQVATALVAGDDACAVRTGNAATVRDLSDVRDAARAYLAAAERRVTETVNVGRGEGHATADVVRALGSLGTVWVEHVEDPALVRAGENPSIVADVGAACERLGWQAGIPLRTTVHDTVEWWARELSDGSARGDGVFG